MKGSEEKQEQKELPSTVEVLDQLMTPGTVLEFPAEEIRFDNSKTVKSLKVMISSTEVQDMAVLHKLHTNTRRAE